MRLFVILMLVMAAGLPLSSRAQSSDTGDTTLAGAYTVNPAGQIGVWDWSRWEEVAGLPAARAYLAAGVLNGALYVVGGHDSSSGTKATVYRYNGTSWTQSASLPAARSHHAVAVLNGMLYSIGGHDGMSAKTNVYRFNGTNWAEVAGLPEARYDLAAGVLNGALYAAGGLSGGTGQTNVYMYNGTNWTEVAGLPEARAYLAAGALNGALYVVGGENSGAKTNVYMYNGTNWSEVAGLPVARYLHATGVLNGSLYAVGGRDTFGNYLTNDFRYNGTNWSGVAGLPAVRKFLAAGVLNGALVAAGGETGGASQTNVYRYPAGAGSGVSPSSGSWTGGYEVVISGLNLGNDSDITNVTICGAAATIVSQSSTQIVVTAASGLPGTGDVVVYSTSYGVTTKTDGFTYEKTDQTITFPAIGDQLTTDTVGLSATASSGLPVSFSVFSGPASISAGTNLTFTGDGTVSIVVSQAGDAFWNAAPNVTNVFDVVPGSPGVEVGGNLAFGNVTTGTTATATISIMNSGDATLTVTDITYPDGFSGAWSGTIVAGGSQDVTVTFAPVAVTGYSGTVTVNSDATSGTNTISASGTGVSASIYEKAITGFRLTTAHSGTLVNEPSWVTGKYGNSLSLSNGKYVTVPAPAPDIFNITGDLTIAMWINPNSVTCSGADPAYALISKRSANRPTPYELFIGNGGSLTLHYWGTAITYPNFSATGSITTGAWQHIAVTRSFSGTNATVAFYINGVAAGHSTAATGPARGSSDPVWLARDGYHTGHTSQGSYSGLMDEVQIYSRGLSASEITQIVSNTISIITNRVGNWRLDESGGTTASDTIADGFINERAKTVTVLVPEDTDVTALVPRITTSPLTTIAPLSGVAQNFVNPVLYTVTAEDLTTQSYTVTVAVPNGLSDADGNGLPDLWELQYFGMAGADPDAICTNGINTVLQAYIAGLNPNDRQSVLRTSVLCPPSSGAVLRWNATSGRLYNVYWTTNLMNGFQPLATNIPWPQNSFTNPTAGTRGFYKIDVRLE